MSLKQILGNKVIYVQIYSDNLMNEAYRTCLFKFDGSLLNFFSCFFVFHQQPREFKLALTSYYNY